MKPLQKLSALHHRAMLLRMDGMTYADIGREVNRTEATIKAWFIDQLFRTTFDDLRREYIDRARSIIQNAAPEAALRIVELKSNPDGRVALAAAKDILDRSDLKPTDKIEAVIDDAGLGDDQRAARIAALLERAREARDRQTADAERDQLESDLRPAGDGL